MKKSPCEIRLGSFGFVLAMVATRFYFGSHKMRQLDFDARAKSFALESLGGVTNEKGTI
jgi:hypothetical protein